MRRYLLGELEALPTLSVGQTSDLKIETDSERIWLSRCSVEDGEPCNHKVTVEELRDGRWRVVATYEAKRGGEA